MTCLLSSTPSARAPRHYTVFGIAFCGKIFIPVFVTLGQLVEKLTLEDANAADGFRRLFLSVFRQESGLKSNNKMYLSHTSINRSAGRPLVPIMGNMNPLYVLPSDVRNNHFNIILPPTPGPLKARTYSSSHTYPIPCRTSVPPCEQHTVQLGLNMSFVCYCTWIKTVSGRTAV